MFNVCNESGALRMCEPNQTERGPPVEADYNQVIAAADRVSALRCSD